MDMEDLIRAIIFFLVVLIPPVLPVILLWLALNPVTFWEKLAALIFSIIAYLSMVVGWIVILSSITD